MKFVTHLENYEIYQFTTKEEMDTYAPELMDDDIIGEECYIVVKSGNLNIIDFEKTEIECTSYKLELIFEMYNNNLI